MKKFKDSYTLRMHAYWSAYYPFMKFYHSIIGILKWFVIVLLTGGSILSFFIINEIDYSSVLGIDNIIAYLLSVLLWAISVFVVYVYFTLQEEMIRLKVDRNFMLYEIDQNTDVNEEVKD